MTILLPFQIPDVFCLDKVHGIQAADHDADDHAGHDLQGRMADHLLQMHILQNGEFFSLMSIHSSIIWLSTLACSPVSWRTPIASCMVMMATTLATAK